MTGSKPTVIFYLVLTGDETDRKTEGQMDRRTDGQTERSVQS